MNKHLLLSASTRESLACLRPTGETTKWKATVWNYACYMLKYIKTKRVIQKKSAHTATQHRWTWGGIMMTQQGEVDSMLSHGTKNKKSDLRTSSFCSFCVSPSFWLWRKTVSVRVSCLRSSISAAKRPLKSASNMQASSTSRERRSPDSLSEAQKAHRENKRFKGCASILAQRKQPPFTHRQNRHFLRCKIEGGFIFVLAVSCLRALQFVYNVFKCRQGSCAWCAPCVR